MRPPRNAQLVNSPAYGRMPNPNLSDNDLKQMDEAWQMTQPQLVVRGLLNRALEDLRAARNRLNRTPKNSSRRPGSMPPWQHGAGNALRDELPPSQTAEISAKQADTEPADEQASPNAPEPSAPGARPITAARVQNASHSPQASRTALWRPRPRPPTKLEPTETHEYRPLCCVACQQILCPSTASPRHGAPGTHWR